MEIYNWIESSESSLPLLEEWKLFRKIENIAITKIDDMLKNKNPNIKILLVLTNTMEVAHREAMDIFYRLHKFR